MVLSDQRPQGEVRLHRGARGTDADDASGAQRGGGRLRGRVGATGFEHALAVAYSGVADARVGVHEVGAKPSPVTEEVAVHFRVVAVVDALQVAVAFARKDIAPDGTAGADRRGRLEVPLARVLLGERAVGEHPGGADLDQVPGELALEDAVLRPAEVHPPAGTERLEVRAAGVVAVEADAPVAGDAAVHLVADERPEVLVLPGAFRAAVPAARVAGHHGHVLQVALAALLADRAVVRVVLHEPLDDGLAEVLRVGRVDGEAHAVAHGGNAGHDEAAAGVLFVGVFDGGALAARPDRTHRRVPAKVGQVEVVREHGLEEVLPLLDRVALPVDDDVCHGRYLVPMPTRLTGPVLYGQPPRSMCASKSARKYFSALDSGSMAPAACRQNVLPGAPM